MKSGMFVAIVAQPPVMEDMLERMSQERMAPSTLYSCFQMSPDPPAFLHMAITTPTQVMETTTVDGVRDPIEKDYHVTYQT